MIEHLTHLFLFFAILYTFHKIRRVHLMLYSMQRQFAEQQRAFVEIKDETRQVITESLDKTFHQLEALIGLSLELGLTKALPATRGWAASPDFLKELALYALQARPSATLECSSGVSTIVLARCMQLNGHGHVYSLEHDLKYAQKTRSELERHELSSWATVLEAPLRPLELKGELWPWYGTDELPELKYDLLVVDGPPGPTRKLARYPAGPCLLPRLNSGAAVFVDDTIREDEQLIVSQWIQEHPELHLESRDCEKGCVVFRKS